jgi:glucose-1-phosphate cytidylyltransferase
MVATGYKKHVIENWVKEIEENWNVQLVDTGLQTQTGGRIKLLMRMFPNDRFFATYGDGVANVNLRDLLGFHESKGKKATVTAVRPPARFGHLEIKNGEVIHFGEKNQSDAGWINGGFFCFEPEVAEYIKDELEPLETGALPRLVHENQLAAYHHYGFWQPMDTLREKQELERLTRENTAPWLETNNHKA